MKLDFNKYTHANLILFGKEWLKNRCDLIISEKGTKINGEIPDIIGFINEDNSILIEVKKSKADYRQDSKKPFRNRPELGMGNFRYYLSHRDVIDKEYQTGWGLLLVRNSKIEVLKDSQYFVSNKKAENALKERFRNG